MHERELARVGALALVLLAPQGLFAQQERFRGAVALMGAREYDRAIIELRELIADYPDFQNAYRSLERASVMLDDVEGARSYLAGRLQQTPDNAFVHHALGRVLSSESVPAELRGDDEDAIAHMEQSIALDPLFARAYRDLAYFHGKTGTSERAVAFFRDRLSDTPAGARAYYGLGYVHANYEHEPDQALEALSRAIELDDELTLAHSERIAVYGQTGLYAKVISAGNTLLELSERLNETDGVGYAHLVLGNGHLYLGDYWRALHHLNESFKLAQAAGEKGREGAALTAIGNVYVTLGEPEKALESHRASYELAKASKDSQSEAIALNNIGHDLAEAGRAEESFEYYEEALEIAKSNGYRYDESVLLLNMASAHEYLGDRERAVDEYLGALVLARELDNRLSEGAILRDLGNIEIQRRRFDEAARYFKEVLSLAELTGDAEFHWAAMGGLGRVYDERGETEVAISHYAEAVALYDTARTAGIESMGSGFLDHYPNVYPPLVRLLAEGGRVEEAFAYAQKYKSANLLQILSEGQSLIGDLLPEGYRARLAEIRNELESAHASLSAARAQSEPDEDAIRALERDLSEVELVKTVLLDEIRREQGSYYQLTSSEPPSLEEVRSTLSPRQALIEYVAGDETLSAFVLTQTELIYHAIPVARERLREMLASLSPVFKKDKAMDEETRARVFNPALADFSIPPARALYDTLIEPMGQMLEEVNELVIVPDGLLHYLPFEMLVAEAAGAEHPYDFEKAAFLVERHAVSYVASASLLDPKLQRPREAERSLLAFGNPDYSRAEEERLPAEFYASALTYSGGVVRGDELLPLPAAELEVGAIEKVLGGSESRVYVGPQATESAFRADAGNYRILHLATHFLSDDRQPLYSKIVLARDEETEQDGYLQTYEIFNMRLNAELAVLSACSTGLGRLSHGEGLAGVSRAFMYAGVPSLVVSLWQVDDEATSILMESFYRHLRKGANKKAALRQAKLDYLRSAPESKNDPFYWAPFILIGDWQPLEIPGDERSYTWMAAFVGAALLLTLWGFGRRRA